ncbi:Uncharacterized protein GBIM_09752 [Gryllus bimaculatus]|nr:Uncharacterized protein GBIM_09752 [Gryllus bimaculatus]
MYKAYKVRAEAWRKPDERSINPDDSEKDLLPLKVWDEKAAESLCSPQDPPNRLIFRHGDRTPSDIYPTDPHQEDAWPEGLGALTNEGKAQMFALGERLRRRYGRFVGAQYKPQALRVDSSAADRCLMSAGALLAGLMPPEGEQRWHPDLAWQPIPVHYVARERDTKLAAKKPCPRYDEELQKAYASPEIQALNEENKDLYQYLTTHAGKPISDITAVEFLYNTLLIEKIHKLDLPEWTNSVFPDKMKQLAAKSLAIFTHNDFMKRIRGGPLLKEVVDLMSKKAEDTVKNEGRMHLFSAHDLTIVNVWRTLGFTELLHVGYGASLIFELRWIEQGVNAEVKVLYLNSSSAEPINLKIPGCSQPCVIGAFVNLIQHNLPTDTDWNKECGLQS